VGFSSSSDFHFEAAVLEESGQGWPVFCRWIDIP